jgi:uncharacterized protein (TIGR03546 family)
MTFWILKQLKKLIKILNSGQTPAQIAGAVALGALVGLVPANTVYYILILLITIIINVNLTSFFFSVALTSLISYLLDPIANKIGYLLLIDMTSLKPFWIFLYNLPVLPLIKINNTLSLGSMLIALILFIPIYIGIKKFVIAYRNGLKEKLEKTKLFKVLKISKWLTKPIIEK